MQESMTITKTRNDAKLILKNMPKELQAACDKIFVAGADFAGAIVNTNERDSSFRIALLEASNTYGKPENSPYKGFADFACAVFGFKSAPAVTQAVKVAQAIDVPKLPKLASWYSTSLLYELRDVSAETLKADVQNGTLHAGMTAKELRAYNNAHKLEDDAPKVIPMYSAYITLYAPDSIPVRHSYTGDIDGLKAKITEIMGVDASVEDDRFFTFNPHAQMEDGKRKTDGKGMGAVFGDVIAKAVYFKMKTEKTKEPTAETVKAQNDTIAALMAELEALKRELHKDE